MSIGRVEQDKLLQEGRPENGLEDEGQTGQKEEEEEEVWLRESGVGFRAEAAPPIAGAPPFGSGTALVVVNAAP